ncbi:hypothetical protein [Synechococcus sp. PCC 7336]|uniref:hypothetical protein n=1 Tax=Synechococcus sp. PCC 7336 TaxID=195250 RepID=UPI0012E9EB05|nr:hypothetical protein [Synechococcus sp. PCC 7336]
MQTTTLTVNYLDFTLGFNCTAVPDTICFCCPNKDTLVSENAAQVLSTKTGKNSFSNPPCSTDLDPNDLVDLLIVDPSNGNRILFTIDNIHLDSPGTLIRDAVARYSGIALCTHAKVEITVALNT